MADSEGPAKQQMVSHHPPGPSHTKIRATSGQKPTIPTRIDTNSRSSKRTWNGPASTRGTEAGRRQIRARLAPRHKQARLCHSRTTLFARRLFGVPRRHLLKHRQLDQKRHVFANTAFSRMSPPRTQVCTIYYGVHDASIASEHISERFDMSSPRICASQIHI